MCLVEPKSVKLFVLLVLLLPTPLKHVEQLPFQA